MTTLKAYKAVIKNALTTPSKRNDQFLCDSLVKIFEFQTASEQANHTTNEDNGVGFTGVDADFATSLAKFYMDKGYLSEKQMGYARKIMPKYSGQLSRIAKSLHG